MNTCRKLLAETLETAAHALLNPKQTLETIRNLQENMNECPIKGCDKLNNTIKELVRESKRTKLLEAEQEYTRLFVAAYPKTPCPPYESVYLGGDGLLLDPEIIRDIKEIMESANIELKDPTLHPDYIPLLLELASFLLEEEYYSLLSRLVYNHLIELLDVYSRCIINNARIEYYYSVGVLLSQLRECLKNTI